MSQTKEDDVGDSNLEEIIPNPFTNTNNTKVLRKRKANTAIPQ